MSLFWSKNGQFSNFFFLGNKRQKNIFYDILERKKVFLEYKKKKWKKTKIDIFPKGLKHGFGSKMAIFPPFFVRQYGPEKWLLWYSRTEKAFLGHKNMKFKKSKINIFPKGVNPWFWSKNGHFSTFFLGNIGQENVFYDILKRKKAFLDYKNKNFFKVEKLTFFQRG